MEFWRNKKVLVTGGAGFLGSFVVDKLKERRCKNVFVARSKDYNLVMMDDVKRLYYDSKPDIVIHLAAKVGGIKTTRDNPGKFFYDNLMMGAQMMEIGKQKKIRKFVSIGTICAYPKNTPVPFKEESLWNGYPEETNAPYGLAKKMLLVQGQAYRKQYEFNAICLLLENLYGPKDNFDPESSHVIPALIKKCIDTKGETDSQIVVWGSGNATREFLYVEDCANAIVLAAEGYNKKEPINIGSGFEISIKELIKIIAKITGFKGKILWAKNQPEGQARRKLDISKAEREFGFKATTTLEEGLKRTIEWYISQ